VNKINVLGLGDIRDRSVTSTTTGDYREVTGVVLLVHEFNVRYS
jgi:hypothetical protein